MCKWVCGRHWTACDCASKAFNPAPGTKLVLTPRQEKLLRLLRDQRSMAPAEIWKALKVSKQGAMNLINPLLDAGLIEKLGSKETGHYALHKP